MRRGWLLVYALILGIVICCFAILNGLEHRQERAPDPTPRTTLIPPVTTTPSAP